MMYSSWVYNYAPIVCGTIALTVFLQFILKLIQQILKFRKESFIYKDFPGPPAHWLFGNVTDVEHGKTIFRAIENSRVYGPAYTFQLGPFIRQIGINDPKFIQVVLNKAEPKNLMYSLVRPWIGDGLLLSKGKKWARNRRLLTPAFHFDILKPYQAIFSQCALAMVDKWKKELKKSPYQSFEMFEHVSLMTLDSLMKCIFGVDENFQETGKKNPYIKSVYDLSELTMKRIWFLPHHIDLLYYFSYNGYRFRKAIRTAHSYSGNIINKRQASNTNLGTSKTSSKYLDFLDVLLECKDEEGNGLTYQEIQDEVDTFMFEGHDTTASGLSWCLYNLARHPEYQEKCRQEITKAVSERNEITWEDLPEFTYLTMCIKESLRLYPPVPSICRLITKDVTLPDGRILREGALVLLGIYSCQHHQKYWTNPEIYDPERFRPGTTSNRHTHSFIGFSAGPRNCIGQHFAMNEMKTTLAVVLKNFRLVLDGSKPAEPLPELILRSKNGLWLHLEPL